MNTILRHAIHATTALALCSACPLASADDGWTWVVAPYVWAAGVSTDLDRSVPPYGGAEGDSAFEDVVDKIDGAFFLHAEGRGDTFGVFSDLTWLSLADSNDRPRVRSESDLDGLLFELAGVWRLGGNRYSGLDLFAGLRYIDIDFEVQLDPVNPDFETVTLDAGDSFSDAMIGARYAWELSDRWGLSVRGDTSFGDTEGTWSASVVADYKTQHGAWLFGYRYLDVSFDTGPSSLDLTLNGVTVGYAFIF
jgi:hypothetical protein